jgi:hypothetical protein
MWCVAWALLSSCWFQCIFIIYCPPPQPGTIAYHLVSLAYHLVSLTLVKVGQYVNIQTDVSLGR